MLVSLPSHLPLSHTERCLLPHLLTPYTLVLPRFTPPNTAKMVQSAVLGFPRMGRLRDLKKANEAYWGGKLSRDDLLAEGKRLRLEHWKIQKDAGVDIIPSNDFAYYDHVLDHIQMFNAVPERYSTQSLSPLTSTLPWAVVTRRTASMCLVWRW